MKFIRYLLLAISIEAIAILVLVLLVALFGPGDAEADQEFARRIGFWVGPIAGFVLCIGGGWLVARKLDARHVANGLALGGMVAAIDVLLLIGGGAEFEPIFVVSNFGRLIAGALGGWFGGRNHGETSVGNAAGGG